MAETVSSSDALEVSVSFGRFENDDSLSWEKWSTFSPNKYLEEAEKCKTPGSVAQKKAYFEAHYKKIAARKAELLDQQKLIENESTVLENPNYGEVIGHSDKVNHEIFMNEDRNSAEEVAKDEKEVAKDEKELSLVPLMDYNLSMDGKTAAAIGAGHDDDADLEDEEVKEESAAESPDLMELKQNSKIEKAVSPRQLVQVQPKKPDLNLQKKPKKTKPVNVEKDSTKLLKTSGSLIVKSTKISTPKVPKPIGAAKAASAVKSSSTEKQRTSTIMRSRNSVTAESKKPAPRSLHMSINLSSSTASLNTSRRSLIMERMGEKEIVKKAFKTFNNNNAAHSKSLSADRSSSHKPAPLVTEQKASSASMRRYDSGRSVKSETATQKASSATHDTAQSSFRLRIMERTEKRRAENNLEGKSDAKEVERARVKSKPKEEKEAEIQKQSKNLNFKAKPLPSFYRTPRKSQGNKTQEDRKSEIRG